MKKSQIPKRHGVNIQSDSIIEGKWHKNHYAIQRKLGSGAIGDVYLCLHRKRRVALKISNNAASMLMEVNVLKSIGKVQERKLGPSLLDVDDWVSPQGTRFTFYVMEYLEGEPIPSHLRKNGTGKVVDFIIQLLYDLDSLHREGWVFGDLKLENLLVMRNNGRIRWIDVGGTTQKGRSIKEYTEFYDRGYWEMGTRRADPAYDLFALAMVVLHIYYPNQFKKGRDPEQTVLQKVQGIMDLKAYRKPMKKALTGEYKTAADMYDDMQSIKQQMTNPSAGGSLDFFRESLGIICLAGFYYLSSLLF